LTKLETSTSSTPARVQARTSAALSSVGMTPLSFWSPSRGATSVMRTLWAIGRACYPARAPRAGPPAASEHAPRPQDPPREQERDGEGDRRAGERPRAGAAVSLAVQVVPAVADRDEHARSDEVADRGEGAEAQARRAAGGLRAEGMRPGEPGGRAPRAPGREGEEERGVQQRGELGRHGGVPGPPPGRG